jgi:MFS family permease
MTSPERVPLPPKARRLIATVAISSLGTGLTLPFTLIMLHEVRHLPLSTVGVLLAVPGFVGLGAVPASGALVDRFGPLGVLRLLIACQVGANLLLAVATTPWQVLPAVVLLGIGLGPSYPAIAGLMHRLVDGPQVQRAFGLQFTALNAAIGVGGLIGAAVVDTSRPATFSALFLGNAVLSGVQGLLLPAPRPVPRAERRAEGSYREVLADPVFRQVCLVTLLLAFMGYAALDSGLPAFARVVGHVSPSVVALVFAVNTAVIVLLQLPVLRLLRHRRRSTSLAVAAAMWALSWALLGAVPGLGQGARVAAMLAFGAVFGIGECFLAPTLQPLVNALATDRLRGRYNALSGSAFSIAFVVSPAVSALLIGAGHGRAWLVGVVLLGGVATVAAARLRGHLSAEQEGLSAALEPEREGRLEVVP